MRSPLPLLESLSIALFLFASTTTGTRAMNSTCTRADQDGQVIYNVDVRTTENAPVGTVSVRVGGHTHTGPSSLVMAGDETNFIREGGAWDCREWQWWEGHSHGDAKRPRESQSEGGMEQSDDLIRIWCRYETDGVATYQEWFFRDQEETGRLIYDCVQTVKSVSDEPLREYGQFFASYTQVNEDKGHWFWHGSGALVNYLSIGADHLDRYITGPNKPFRDIGNIRHCPRGDGLISGTRRHPVSVSHPSAADYRHIVLCEPRTTSAITMGMQGIAQDYLIHPRTPDQTLTPGATFTTHIRHAITRLPDGQETKVLQQLWGDFEGTHKKTTALSRASF